MKYLYWSNIFMLLTVMVIHYFDFDNPLFLIPWFGVVAFGFVAVDKEERMNNKIKELENKIEQLEKT